MKVCASRCRKLIDINATMAKIFFISVGLQVIEKLQYSKDNELLHNFLDFFINSTHEIFNALNNNLHSSGPVRPCSLCQCRIT